MLAEELASTSSSTLSNDDYKISNVNFDDTKLFDDCHTKIEDDRTLSSTAELEDESLIVAAAASDEIDVKCLENWLFDDEEDENYLTDASSFDFSFSSSSFDETVSLPKPFSSIDKMEHQSSPTVSTSIYCFADNFHDENIKLDFESIFKQELNPLSNALTNVTSSTQPIKEVSDIYSNEINSTNTIANHYVFSDDNNNENSNSSCETGTSYNSEIACANFEKNDSGFNSSVSTPELALTTENSATTIAPNCALVVPSCTETVNEKNNFTYCNNTIFKHQGFGQLFEF